jgi:hypothetical protein
MHVDDV